MNDETMNDQQPNDLENQLKRALADYANLKNRSEKEKEDAVKFGNEMLMLQMIGILDGLEMTVREFRSVLGRSGFSRIEVDAGSQFDPNIMEATDTDGQGDAVVEVYAPAYKLHDRVIRPAKVRLGKLEKKESHG